MMNHHYLNSMHKLLICLSLLFSFQLSQAVEIEKLDRIIAVVDQSVITEQELLEKARSVALQLEKKGAEKPYSALLSKITWELPSLKKP